MTQKIINVGTTANDGTGDPLRLAFQNVNSNFTEVYSDVEATNSNVAYVQDSANALGVTVNSSFDTVNAVYASSNSNWVVQNVAYSVANAGYNKVNSAYISSNASFDLVNSAYDMANAGYVVSNSSYAVINAAYTSLNTAYAIANSTWSTQNLVYATVNVNFNTANAAFNFANGLAVGSASEAYNQANQAFLRANAVYDSSNAGIISAYNWTNTVATSANSYSLGLATSGNLYAQQVGTAGNNYTNTLSATNLAIANSYGTQVGAAGNNYTNTVSLAANNYTNTLFISASAAFAVSSNVANAAYNTVNSVYSLANAEYAFTNTVYAAANAVYTSYVGFKNLIHNGDFRIDQRLNGGSVSESGYWTNLTDRWITYSSPRPTGGPPTYVRQFWRTMAGNSRSYINGVNPPEGFSSYLYANTQSPWTANSGDIQALIQCIEGFNTVGLRWGTANARPVTLSFWTRSTIPGTFSGSVKTRAESGANTFSYPFTYTMSVGNTWTYSTVSIPGPTSNGTPAWPIDANSSIVVAFSMGTGAASKQNANTWVNTNAFGANGETVQLTANLNAEFYITGVQLEAGNTASPFEIRPITTELDICQRYFEMDYYRNTGGVDYAGLQYYTGSGSTYLHFIDLKKTKRITPTVGLKTGNWTPVAPTITASKTSISLYWSNPVSGPLAGGNTGQPAIYSDAEFTKNEQ